MPLPSSPRVRSLGSSSRLWTVSFRPLRRHAVHPPLPVPPTGGISRATARKFSGRSSFVLIIIHISTVSRGVSYSRSNSASQVISTMTHLSHLRLRDGRAPSLFMEPVLSLRTACSALRWESVSGRLLHACQIRVSRARARQRRDRLRMWHELTRRICRLAFKRRQLTGLQRHLSFISERGTAD